MKKIFFLIISFIFCQISFCQNTCITSFYSDYKFTIDENNKVLEKSDKEAKYKARIDLNICDHILIISNKFNRNRVEYDSIESKILKYKESHELSFYYKNIKVAEMIYDLEGNFDFELFDENKRYMYIHNK